MSAAPVRLAQTADPSAVRDELLDRSLRSGWVLVYLNILIALFLGTIQLTSGYDPGDDTVRIVAAFVFIIHRKPDPFGDDPAQARP